MLALSRGGINRQFPASIWCLSGVHQHSRKFNFRKWKRDFRLRRMELCQWNSLFTIKFYCPFLSSPLVMGAVVNKTNFCTMGAVSDWVNMGDTGRLRAWLLAIAVALSGVLLFEGTGGRAHRQRHLSRPTVPATSPGCAMCSVASPFGIGMTLASGCGNKTSGALRCRQSQIPGGAHHCRHRRLFHVVDGFFQHRLYELDRPTMIDLQAHGIPNQSLQAIVGAPSRRRERQPALAHRRCRGLGAVVFCVQGQDFRGSFDNILGGSVVGLAVVGLVYYRRSHGGGLEEWADFADEMPSRVAAILHLYQSHGR